MKFIKLIFIAAAVAGLTACPQRQPALHVVYVPAPPPAPSSGAGQGGVMVIQKPAPAQPAVTASKPEQPPEPAEQSAAQPTQRVARKEEEVPAPASPNATPPAGDAPQLEPARSLQQQAALERQIKSLQEGLQQRMARLSRRALSSVDQETLEDARTLLVQSGDAMKTGDFLQSLNLAQKADLLVAAIEKQY